MARFGSGAVVTVLTASALALVTMLALQAKSSASTTTTAGAKPGASASASGSTPGQGQPSAAPKPPAVPADSGSGKRVVYSLKAKRVWLVDPGNPGGDRTFAVMPSPVSPLAATYTVDTTIASPYTGSDGVKIKDGVLFATRTGVRIGFSAAVDGTMPSPDPTLRTGGIREALGDGQALFAFAPKGTKVVVIP
ncbi:hypothetical protein [Streptacidiphilus sp. EB129]|uniref:hypothetical protein n=1 Tax=Streptacidiphilus sp. EB129 TaxID=3156262 RepID=UPI0035174195